MNIKDVAEIGLPLVQLGISLAEKKITEEQAALAAADYALSKLPVDQLRAYLAERAKQRILDAEDAAATALFGPSKAGT